jgi:2-dehydro-3-deoxyglucarate aldolase
MALCGYDFLTLDAEHSPLETGEVHRLAQAIRAGNPQCACLVRLPNTDYYTIKRYMDAGANGVIAPLVNCRAQAQEVVDAVKYPPHGKRGVGFACSNKYGLELSTQLLNEHEQSTVVVQIEHVDALAVIDEILSVEGVDGVMVGPYDLSASMGIAGQVDHPDIQTAITQIEAACRRNDVVPGIHVVQPDTEAARERLKQGYRLLAYSLDITMLAQSSRAGLAAIRESAGGLR